MAVQIENPRYDGDYSCHCGMINWTISDNERYRAVTRERPWDILVWDLETGQIVWSHPNPECTSTWWQVATCWTRDSTRLISHAGSPLEVCEFPSMDLVYRMDKAPPSIIPSDDAHHILIGEGRDKFIAVVNVEDGSSSVIDTNYLNVQELTNNGFLHATGAEELRKLRFDWATSVIEASPALVHSFFPNPCQRAGTLEYDVPGTQQVSVVLYDVTDQAVRYLASGMQSGPQPVPQPVPLDCASLPVGAYYAVQHVGGQTFSHQVLISGEGGAK